MARVFVGFIGNPYDLSDQEKRELADAFFDTYVSLDERDNVNITSVRFVDDLNGIDSSTAQRELQDSLKDFVDYAISFTKLLGITGKCNDCDDHPKLFPKPDDVPGRRLAIPFISPHHYLREESLHRKTQESCVGCPTIEEFVTNYKDAIASLQADGRLVNVVILDGNIVEQEPVECPSDDLTEFESILFVSLNTTAEPSDAEVAALECSFVESYNQANALNGETCDLSFRVVDYAVISVTGDGFGNEGNRRLKNSALTSGGSCRGCEPKHRITGGDISARRRALHSGIPLREHSEWRLDNTGLLYGSRGLQNTATDVNQCYCPIGEPEKGLPSIEELLTIYDNNVQFLVDDGVLTSITSVDSIVADGKDDCDPNPCLYGGSCIDGLDGYSCTCLAGFSGINCEIDTDDCSPNPCLNGGTCLDGVNSYSCTCPSGYLGDNCETNIDDCNPTPCQNGGTCTDSVNSYTCTCPEGFEGTDCEINADCSPNLCQNDGTCNDGVNSYTCTWPEGSEGINCEINVDNCSPNPCLNGGTCIDVMN
jgi:hypothetical protein